MDGPELEEARRNVAVLMERSERQREAMDEARAARADLNDKVELLAVTLTSLSERVSNLAAAVGGLQTSQRWLVQLVLGMLLTALVTAVLGGALGHVQVR